VQCEQFKLNQVLAARLAEKAKIEFGCQVTDVRQDAGSVSVTVNGEKQLTAQWLIGADGGRSRVREALGIPLEGFTWPERFLVASTAFDFAGVIPGLCDVSYFADPEEWFFLLRVPGVWRVMFPVREHEDDAEVLSEASIQRRLHRVHPASSRFEIRHRTLYSVHQRVAQSYRKGRCFLAGDAAHLNNPLGGMGMNGGIHDGFNIAQKLARVIRERADAAELDRYERQRKPVALDYVNRITIANKRNLEARDAGEHERWKALMTRTAADPRLAREYMLQTSMIASLRRHECD
jgi:3-(3-hydroxy-phenyl)propionate hydroxylase